MKKRIAILLMATAVFSLSACGKEPEPTVTTRVVTPSPIPHEELIAQAQPTEEPTEAPTPEPIDIRALMKDAFEICGQPNTMTMDANIDAEMNMSALAGGEDGETDKKEEGATISDTLMNMKMVMKVTVDNDGTNAYEYVNYDIDMFGIGAKGTTEAYILEDGYFKKDDMVSSMTEEDAEPAEAVWTYTEGKLPLDQDPRKPMIDVDKLDIDKCELAEESDKYVVTMPATAFNSQSLTTMGMDDSLASGDEIKCFVEIDKESGKLIAVYIEADTSLVPEDEEMKLNSFLIKITYEPYDKEPITVPDEVYEEAGIEKPEAEEATEK